MSTALNIAKGVLKLAWGLFKIALLVADAAITISGLDKKTPRYNELDARELFHKGEISLKDYREATRRYD
ncbi:hypothetical protein [Legionella feeleii]|uniref:Uncharacterized protein n=1 Tax=Legionella feeleii TaxID=453 RepID=A0A0W0TH35_9GAMM|nr:hypothetical protein [Legionella feeleii]KTC94873.1 hypothetical protein Lfee_2537 [Legionella feeleii]SPX62043.1 Uncharacterised protein [Legionella feeleii]